MKVNLTYYKSNGKYYCEGEYESDKDSLLDILDEVQNFRNMGILPGLIDGADEFIISVDVPDHPHIEYIVPNKFLSSKFDICTDKGLVDEESVIEVRKKSE